MSRFNLRKSLLLTVLGLYLTLAVWGWSDRFPADWEYVRRDTALATFYPPSHNHILGIFFQQDLFVSFVRSTYSAFVAGSVALVAFLVIGILLGVGSGINIGKWQDVLNGTMKILNAFPKFIVLLLYAGLFSVNLIHMLILYGIISAPKLGELLKARIEELKREDFIDASIALGIPIPQIIARHVLWHHSRHMILSQLFYMFAMAIFMEASLAYLNLGIEEGYQSWGLMLNYATSVGGLTFFTWPWNPNFNLPAFLPSMGLLIVILTLFGLSSLWAQEDKKRRGWTI